MDGGAWWATVHGFREYLKINLTADIENRLVNTVGGRRKWDGLRE